MTAAVAALGGVMFLRMLAVFITLPVVALYADALQHPPSSAALTGIALGAYGITQAAAQIGFGMYADKRGRKPALLLALALFVIGGFWAAAAGGIGELIAARLLQGAGAAAAAIMAWLSDITPPTFRGRAMAIVGVGVGLAFALSLFVAAPVAGHFGAARVFDIAASLGVCAFIVVLLLPPPVVNNDNKGGDDESGDTGAPMLSILPVMKMPGVLAIAAGAFSLHCALAALFLLLPERMVEGNMALADHWRVYAPAFLLSLPPAYYLLRRADKLQRHNDDKAGRLPMPVLSAAIMPVVAGLFVIAASMVWDANAALVWAAGLFLFFCGFNATEAILPALASRIAGRGRRGTIMGAVLSCQFAGLFVGGAGGGMLSGIGEGFALAMAAVLILLWLVVISGNQRGG